MKLFKLFSIMILVLANVVGQPANVSSLTYVAQTPPSPRSPSTSLIGNAGSGQYYYWVVARYMGGRSAPSPATIIVNAPNTLDGSNYVRLNWGTVINATGYDLLRTTTANIPNGDCNCAVVINTTATTANDQGGALLSYTLTTQAGATNTCILDNINYATPTLVCSPYGGTGGGSSTLTVGTVTNTSSTVLTTTTGLVRFGNTPYTIPSATMTITAGAGNGTAKVFITSAGAIVIEHSTAAGLTVTCSNCVQSQVVTPTVPVTAIPLATITITAGQWGTAVDERAFLSTKPITAGLGMVITDSLGEALIAIDPAEVVRTSSTNTLLGTYDYSGATVIGLTTGFTAAAGTFDYCVFGTCSAASSDTWVASRPYYQQIIVPGIITNFRYYAIRVGAAGSGNGALALYDNTCTKVSNTDGNFSATANAVVKVTNTANVTLSPGIYYIGYSVESAAALVYGDSTALVSSSLLNQGSVLTHFYGSNAPSGSAGTFAMPSSCGTKTSFGGGETAGSPFPSIRLAN